MLSFLAPQNLDRLQKVQNNAARLIYRSSKFNHVTPLLHTLHWLPIEKKGLISNLLHFALNLRMVLPLPTSQIFFTFTLLLGNSVLLQTPVCSEYHPFAQSQVVSALSLTKLQQHGTNSPLLSVTYPLSVPSDLSSVLMP